MYVKDEIAYAGEQARPVTVISVRPLKDYKLWVKFSTGEEKVFDFTPLLDSEAFKPLQDEESFQGVYVDYGVTVWNDGEIDIAPEYLYANGVSA
jgi:hypothetical protein